MLIFLMTHYVVCDLETTGLSKNRHGITEIAAVRWDGEKEVERFHTLVNPERHIPTMIERLTGISNAMVADAPVMRYALGDFFDFLGDDPLVAHNSTFDVWFLAHHGHVEVGHVFHNDAICTRKLANRLLPELPSKRLEMLCQHFGIQNMRAHRAMADVEVTVHIFEQFVQMLQQRDCCSLEDIVRFQSR
jgi:DNA polymerase III epsilon subunit family exonuclease